MNAWTQANIATKRALFPLRGPRYQTQAYWPLHVLAAAIDGYHAALMAVYNGSRM